MKGKSHIFRGLASICICLLVTFAIVAQVANSWAGKVNELLGVADTIERSSDPDDYTYKSDFENGSELIEAEIAYNTRLEAEGAVALKGQPALSGRNVSLFGMRSGEKMQFGCSMGGLIDASNIVTLDQALTEEGFSVNETLVNFYVDMEADYSPSRAAGGNVVSDYSGAGMEINEVPQSEYSAAGISDSLDGYKDAAIVVFGRDAGESCCYYPGANGIAKASEFTQSPTGNILSLSNDERDLISYVKSQGFSQIVVLINSAVPMEIDELDKDDAIDSILWIGTPGAYGTYGIAKLLSGEYLPSGHLQDTYAVNTALAPAVANYGIFTFTNTDEIETTSNNALRSDWYLVEAEGIYTGYKYYETRYFDTVMGQGNASAAGAGQAVNNASTWDYDNEVTYAFGYGVEGSTFTEEIADINIDWTGETESTVTVDVTNTGDVAAKHVVQVYVSQPYTDYDKANGIEKAAVQLAGYAKTGEAEETTYADYVTLAPGESETVIVSFNASDIISWDSTYSHDGTAGAYHLEAGDYYFATGNGAHEAVNAVINAMQPEAEALETSGTVATVTVDDDIYITEGADGYLIENELTDGDLNSYGANMTVTYLTRSNWNGTFPKAYTGLTATEEMITLLRNETYDAEAELAAYDGPTEFTQGADNGISAVDMIGLDYDDPKWDELLDEVNIDTLINQYIAYLGAVEEINMPKEQRADAPSGLIGKIGQYSGGSIYEVSEDDPSYGHFVNVYATPMVTASSFSHLLASENGRMVGNDSLWTGYNTWFGPGMNLHRTAYNGRNVEYYSEDAILTGQTAADVIKAAGSYGLVMNSKHFAFNDQETNRDGLAAFISEQAGRENELTGFKICFRDGELNGIMTAFNRLGCTHVGADRGLMNGILRGEWGFKGQIITDSVKSSSYFLPRECIMAGNNEMLGGSNNGDVWNLTEDAVKADPVLWNALRESYHQKLYTYVNSNIMNGITADTDASGAVLGWVLALRIAMGLAFVGAVVFIVLYIINFRKEKKA